MKLLQLFFLFTILLSYELYSVNSRRIKILKKNQNKQSQRVSGTNSIEPIKYYLDPAVLRKLLTKRKRISVPAAAESPTVTGTATGTGSATGTMTATGTSAESDSALDDVTGSASEAMYATLPVGNRFPIFNIDTVRANKKHKHERKHKRKPGRSRRPYVIRGYNRGADETDYDY